MKLVNFKGNGSLINKHGLCKNYGGFPIEFNSISSNMASWDGVVQIPKHEVVQVRNILYFSFINFRTKNKTIKLQKGILCYGQITVIIFINKMQARIQDFLGGGKF